MEKGVLFHYHAYKIYYISHHGNLSLFLFTSLEPVVSFLFLVRVAIHSFVFFTHSFILTVVHLTKIQLDVQHVALNIHSFVPPRFSVCGAHRQLTREACQLFEALCFLQPYQGILLDRPATPSPHPICCFSRRQVSICCLFRR